MKKIFLLLISVFMLSTANIKAQITLEHSLDSVTGGGQFYCTDLGNNDFKYVMLDTFINGFHLYNMDMTPYMTVPIPTSYGKIIYDYTAIYITKTLFDCDSTNIEFVYTAPYNSYKTPFYVFRTDGAILLKVDSARGPYGFGGYDGSVDIRPIINTSDGAKLFIDKYNQKYGTGWQIYSLCGTLPANVYDFSDHKSFVKIFPNPASMELNFEVTPPNNQQEFDLVIFDIEGKEKKIERHALSRDKFYLDVSGLNSGTYLFSLKSKDKIYESGKFTITK